MEREAAMDRAGMRGDGGAAPRVAAARRAGARRIWVQAGAVALGAAPLLALGLRAVRGDLGANPIEEITHETGDWTLRLLLLALAVTPARRWLGPSWLAPLRRTLGLLAFAWVCLHLVTYVALDQVFDWPAMLEDVRERRYVTVGFAGFLCLLPLAITSTRRWQRRLGPRWIRLHRLVYVAATCGVVHYLWLAKADLRTPLVYASLLALLLLLRLRPPRPGGRARA
jgi:sulfoxide reductase heme-binding subunit YedZ